MNWFNLLIDKYGMDRITLLISLTSVLFTAVFILVNDEFAKFIIANMYEVVTNIFGSSYFNSHDFLLYLYDFSRLL